MTEPRLRFRKTPKTPFLAGNLLLAAFAASLVFFGPDPWSVSTVLLVVLCLAAGGLLTLLPFLLDQFALLNLQRTRFSQAAVNLKAAVERSEAVVAELRERQAEDHPLRLVSERLPDLVESKLKEALRRGGKSDEEARTEIREALADLRTLPDQIERMHEELRTLSSHAATREFLAAGIDNLSAEIVRVRDLAEDLRRFRLFGLAPDEAGSPGEAPDPPAPEIARPRSDEGPGDAGRKEKESSATDGTAAAPAKTVEEDEIPVEDKRKNPTSKKRPSEIIVSAFVGIRNAVFLRGDGPGLSPETGTRLEMTGIGEWVWTGRTETSFSAELFLNDEIPSDLGGFTVNPGDTLKLNPTFGEPREG
jgi:hypothetical protein